MKVTEVQAGQAGRDRPVRRSLTAMTWTPAGFSAPALR